MALSKNAVTVSVDKKSYLAMKEILADTNKNTFYKDTAKIVLSNLIKYYLHNHKQMKTDLTKGYVFIDERERELCANKVEGIKNGKIDNNKH